MMRKYIIASVAALIAFVAMGAQRIEDAYIAPENHYIFKLVFPDGLIREFQRDPARYDGLMSLGGWDGDISADGKIVIRGRENGVLNQILTFDRGRLVSHQTQEGKKEFAYDAPRKPPKSRFSPLDIVVYENAKEIAEEYNDREMATKWIDSGRLAFPYTNPNHSGALYAQLALVSLALLFLRRKGVFITGGVLFAFFTGCLLMTGSRGSFLGLFCGLSAIGVFRFRDLVKSRLFWSLFALFAIGLILYLVTGGYQNITRGFTAEGSLGWSNAIRVDMMKAAPFMMVDAPGGWEACHVGKAYLDWYQPIEMLCLTGSLMNDHLSILVKVGWWMRFGYLFILFGLLGCALAYAVIRKNPVPLAVALAHPVMACLNPVFSEWGLWIVPVAALLPTVTVLRRIKPALYILLSAAVLSGLTLLVFSVLGSRADRGRWHVPIHVEGRRISVNGTIPGIWVVDDMRGTLGGNLFGKDIRSFYDALPDAPALGYVTDIADLPRKKIDRLVLAGKAGVDWLEKLSADPSARTNLPKSVVFVSPPFSPSEIPEGVMMCCSPAVLVGEFAARYNSEYLKPEPWIMIVPAMEKYILMWPQYVIGE